MLADSKICFQNRTAVSRILPSWAPRDVTDTDDSAALSRKRPAAT